MINGENIFLPKREFWVVRVAVIRVGMLLMMIVFMTHKLFHYFPSGR